MPSATVVFIASFSTASAKSLKVSFVACARCSSKSSDASRISAPDSPWNNDFICFAQQQMLRRINNYKKIQKKFLMPTLRHKEIPRD